MKAARLLTATRACLIACLILAPSHTAFAQLSRLGTSVEAIVGTIGQFRGVDGAYDPRNDSYLMVGGNNAIYGVCVGANGVPKAAPFTIKPLGGAFGAFPRARYSPHIDNGNGGFLVVWVGEAGSTGWGPVYSRVVSCTSGVLGIEQVIDPALAYLEAAPAIAYSETSQKFLVVWKGGYVTAKLVDNAGTGVGKPALLSMNSAWTVGRDPGVTWNPTHDDFGVSFSGETYSAFVRVPATNPAAFFRHTMPVSGSARIYITDIDYNPVSGTYLMTWWENGLVKVAEFDVGANLLGVRLASTTLGSYDALSIAANPLTGSYLLVGVDHPLNGANTDAVIAAELNSNGVPLQGEIGVSTTVPPARHPRVVASRNSKTWNASWAARNFAALGNQVVQTSTTGGGGTPAPAPPAAPPPAAPPPPPVTKPWMFIDHPGANATVSTANVVIAGWAADQGAPSGTGVHAIHVWAFPTFGGSPTFLGEARYGVARPDVGAFFGNSRFTNTGFDVTGTLPVAGVYDITVFGLSTVTGNFTFSKTVRVNAVAPVSNPIMWTDLPAPNSVVGTTFHVAGWAIDLGPGSGPGVSTIHVWAYPSNGAPPIWVGVAPYGGSRPDIAAAFGHPRFTNSGFNMLGSLPVGDYTLVAFAYSTVINNFNNVSVKPIRVR
jgi:hypothetical protein